jgi:tungstate transport system permease protein
MGQLTESVSEALALLTSGSAGLWPIIGLSLFVSGIATAIGLVIGLPAGFFLGTHQFTGKRWTLTLVNTGMAFPPVVIGLLVFMMLSRNGPLGNMELLYTVPAMIIAQIVLAVPLIAGVSAAGIAQVPKELALQARSLGASRVQESWLILKEARAGVLAAIVAGFGGAISEVGAVQMVGGNIEGQTRVMTTFIMMETRKGEFGRALALGFILLGLAFVVNGILTVMQQSGARYEQ